jgi:hypothetical protein
LKSNVKGEERLKYFKKICAKENNASDNTSCTEDIADVGLTAYDKFVPLKASNRQVM